MFKWIIILALAIGGIYAFSKMENPEQFGQTIRQGVDEGREKSGKLYRDTRDNARRAADGYRGR